MAMKQSRHNRPAHRLAMVVAVPLTLRVFMRPHLEAMASRYSVTVFCAGDASQIIEGLPKAVDFCSIPIQRKISLCSDARALWCLVVLFSRGNYDLVHSITPKAGLLAMCAAFFCRVSFRVHIFTGQVWVTKAGLSRCLLKTIDRLIAAMATHVLADSHSQRQFLVDEGVVPAEKIRVLADGSICGVDQQRFRPNEKARFPLRRELGLPESSVVALFLGRLTRDKGVLDLAKAFVKIADDHQNLYLIIVGPDEEGLRPALQEIMSPCLDRIRFVDMTSSPEDYMASSDIFCLPSYREGFGSVIIEAAASGVPSVASNIYGLSDAVENGQTGILHRPGDITEIGDAIALLSTDAQMRAEMGARARKRAAEQFSSERVVSAQMDFYDELLHALGEKG